MKINEPIAIVGMGGVFPKASTVRDFWKNILERVDCIEDIATRDNLNYWRAEDYLDPQPFKNNKTYARKAGFLPPIEFDAARYGIPPKSLEALSTTQLYALYVAEQTLTDARLSIEETTPEQRAHVSVILGVGGWGHRRRDCASIVCPCLVGAQAVVRRGKGWRSHLRFNSGARIVQRRASKKYLCPSA